MKRFLKKRWLGLPVGIITVVLLVCLLAGSALATGGYGFFKANLDVKVREAIAVGTFDSWDNLHPYGSDVAAVWYDCDGDSLNVVNIDGDHDKAAGKGVLGDLYITISNPEDPEPHVITITHVGSGSSVGSGLTPAEWIVIPLNIRNGSSGALDLGATAEAAGLVLEYIWEANDGTPDADGCDFSFMPTNGEAWASLDTFYETIEGYGGESGSAKVGAQVLFVKISVPQAAIPGDFDTVTFSLARGVVISP